MSTPEHGPDPDITRRSRSVLVSFLGAIVRRLDNWMPIGGTVELIGQLGLDPPSVRTAVFRLKKSGWLVSEAHGRARGYSLTDLAVKALSAGDEIIWHARRPADLDDGWCIVHFSIPESVRVKRDRLRSHLSALGFGNIGTAMWIAPARMQGAALEALAELGLAKYASLFVGAYVGGQDLRAVLYESWDLAEINQHYKDFIDEFEAEADLIESVAPDPQRAFVTYLGAVNRWRKLPFRDPGLPGELLADDWSAPAAVAVFERLVTSLEASALAHAARHWQPTA